MKQKGKSKLAVIVIALVFVVVVGFAVDNKVNKENSIFSKIVTSTNNGQKNQNKEENSKENGNSSNNQASNENNEDKNKTEENDKNNLAKNSDQENSTDENTNNVSSNPRGENGSYSFNMKSKNTKVNSEKLPYKLPDKKGISIEKVGQYNGQYLENGKDEKINNVFSVLVKNNSKEMLQYAELKFKVDGQDANFVVTNLPPNKSVLVLEADKKSFSKTNNISYEGASTSYIDSYSINKDKFKVKADDTQLTLKNLTTKEYSTVYVYYKNVDENGVYLGGITYRTKFENVKPNKSITEKTEHYLEGASDIIMIDYIE